MEPPRQRGALPFSAHARGVPLFERGRFFDLPRHVARALLDLRDISSAFFWFLSCQTWLTLWSFLITLISVTFFSFYKEKSGPLAAPLDWVLICSVAVLPAVGFLWIAYLRRERALDELAQVRVLMIGIFTAHRDWVPETVHAATGHLEAVREALAVSMDAMRAYFTPMRFYSRYYPYFGFRGAMVHIALDRTQQMRRISSSMQELEAATVKLHGTVNPSLLAQLHDRNMRLQLSIQRMANIKEFRTPQGVRSLTRFYLIFFLPVFFGPYWSWVRQGTDFSFAFFFSILMQVAVTGLVNATIALEDPYDNNGLDGVFLDEVLYDIESTLGLLSNGSEPKERAAVVVPTSFVGPSPGQAASSPFAAVSRSQPLPASAAKPPAAPTDTV